jgi:hypothetical protein
MWGTLGSACVRWSQRAGGGCDAVPVRERAVSLAGSTTLSL